MLSEPSWNITVQKMLCRTSRCLSVGVVKMLQSRLVTLLFSSFLVRMLCFLCGNFMDTICIMVFILLVSVKKSIPKHVFAHENSMHNSFWLVLHHFCIILKVQFSLCSVCLMHSYWMKVAAFVEVSWTSSLTICTQRLHGHRRLMLPTLHHWSVWFDIWQFLYHTSFPGAALVTSSSAHWLQASCSCAQGVTRPASTEPGWRLSALDPHRPPITAIELMSWRVPQ